MDINVVSGTVRCQLCHEALQLTRSFATTLRTLVCVNPLCHAYAYPRETSLYTQVLGQPTTQGS